MMLLVMAFPAQSFKVIRIKCYHRILIVSGRKLSLMVDVLSCDYNAALSAALTDLMLTKVSIAALNPFLT